MALAVGCAPHPNSLPAPELQGMRRMLVVVRVQDPKLQVIRLEHARTFGGSPTIGGAVVELFVNVASAARAAAKVDAALGGNVDSLRTGLRGWDPVAAFRAEFDTGFVSHYQPYFVVVAASPETTTAHVAPAEPKELARMGAAAGADLVFEMGLEYGILGTSVEPPTVAVFPKVRVVKVATRRVLFDQYMSSARAYWSSHTVRELAADHGRVFRDQFGTATGKFCEILAQTIGRPLPATQPGRSHWSDKP